MYWIVRAEPNPHKGWGVYRSNYFPRKFRYKRDAEKCANEAYKNELVNVQVEKSK